MLVLSRKKNESIVVTPGNGIAKITVVEIRGDKVCLGFEGSRDWEFLRQEVYEALVKVPSLWENLLPRITEQCERRKSQGLSWRNPQEAQIDHQILAAAAVPVPVDFLKTTMLYVDPHISFEPLCAALSLPSLPAMPWKEPAWRPDRPYLLFLEQDGREEFAWDPDQIIKRHTSPAVGPMALRPAEVALLSADHPEILDHHGLTAAGAMTMEGYVLSLLKTKERVLRWLVHRGRLENCGSPTAFVR